MTNKKIIDAIQEMISELSGVKRASVNTITAYSRDLKDFLNFCSEHKLTEINQINERHIRLYLMNLNEKNLSKSSVTRKLSSLRKLFNFAIRNDLIEKNPLRKTPNPKIKRKLPETINRDYYESILKSIDEKIEDRVQRIRNKTIFELLYGCALRVSELCSLNTEDVDLRKMNVRVLGKGSKVRIVPIGNKSLPIIEDYMNEVKPNYNEAFLKNNKGKRINRYFVYKLVRRFLKDSEIKKKSPHVLRHSAATHMLDKDADLMAVKEILGHENLSTTQIYTHVSIERIKKVYKQAHPKSSRE